MKLEHQAKLNRIREHLGISVDVCDGRFTTAVRMAARDRLADLHRGPLGLGGEDFIQGIASELNVTFEEVHTPADVKRVQHEYLKKKEIGFGQLELELNNPGVDALLFQRQKKEGHYVAVLNLQETQSRAYWNRSHELSHRLIEPPQQEMMFRHRASSNPVEDLVDIVAGEIAFYEPLFAPVVASYTNQLLSWQVVDEIGHDFSPSASRLSLAKSVLNHWPRPAFLVFARLATRKNQPHEEPALRIEVKGLNSAATSSGVFFKPNMRVPADSAIFSAYFSNSFCDGIQRLSSWTTSRGDALPGVDAYTSAMPYNGGALAVVTLI